MSEIVLRGCAPPTPDPPSRSSARPGDARSDRAFGRDSQNGSAVSVDGGADRRTGRSQLRQTVTFTVVTVLLVGFVAIVAWGLAHSDWLYGTYGDISQTNWDEISRLRTALVHLGTAPGAVAALDDALLVPRPSTEDVLYDLQKAVLILRTHENTLDTNDLLADLRAVIQEIQPGHTSRLTDWPTPVSDFPDLQFPQK